MDKQPRVTDLVDMSAEAGTPNCSSGKTLRFTCDLVRRIPRSLRTRVSEPLTGGFQDGSGPLIKCR